MKQQSFGFRGLTHEQVEKSRREFGANVITSVKKNIPWILLKKALREPMLLILVAVSTIYFVTSSWVEGVFMLAATSVVSFISLYQEFRTKKALESLKQYTEPKSKVIRDWDVTLIKTEDIVVGDYLILEEGFLVPADAIIIQARDFSVNESLLTGESLAVEKQPGSSNNNVYQGTSVLTGLAIGTVTEIGINTKMGQIGSDLQTIREEPSPLDVQIHQFVRNMAFIGGFVFVTIWAISFFKSWAFIDSLLKALTLAMSIIPEEIPVAFATFMALGAWRLMTKGILVRNTKTIETLGSASVICVDKTGTITKNVMSLVRVYDFESNKILDPASFDHATDVITTAMWASEPVPFDPMEKALHEVYGNVVSRDLRTDFSLVHEYPLSGVPPIMTHVFKNHKGEEIIASKGAPEAIIALSNLSSDKQQIVRDNLEKLLAEGYRVLAVGQSTVNHSTYPRTQHELKLTFKGFVAFYDPPKENIASVLLSFYKAGVDVKIITGDNAITTQTIARQIHFKKADHIITGDEVMKLSDAALQKIVSNVAIYARMFPEAKLRIVEAFKKQNKIVAMVGDGVNDAPALKAANIGIAMGSKGTEVAKEASALILSNDDLSEMITAIAMGRKIYNNLKKAIQYIISIHVPIILVVFLPVLLGWTFPTIFTPIHIIFLELVMGPTCSIVYENEPIEAAVMSEPPRKNTKTFFRFSELTMSLVQGLIITTGLLTIYWISLKCNPSIAKTTSMMFIGIVTSNVVLTLVNRSFTSSVIKTMRFKNNLIPVVIIGTPLAAIAFFIIAPVRDFFHFTVLAPLNVTESIAIGAISVLWVELYKLIRRRKRISTAGQ